MPRSASGPWGEKGGEEDWALMGAAPSLLLSAPPAAWLLCEKRGQTPFWRRLTRLASSSSQPPLPPPASLSAPRPPSISGG